MSLTLLSPAKVNLFLRILGKRRDGYHALASLFHTVDLADTLTFTLSNEDSLTCSHPSLIPNNLITQALALFREKTGLNFHLSVHLDKKIPIQAGLGGGSSNAATTLKGINQLLGNPIAIEELQEWSARLGSDVPFFFSSGTAYCTGRGEIVKNVPPFQGKIQLYPSSFHLSTPAVYKELDLQECSQEDPEALLDRYLNGELVCMNDLERPAFRLLPELAAFKKKTGATLSGSGPTFFIPQNSVHHYQTY